jgi:chromosomal replication initiator protein
MDCSQDTILDQWEAICARIQEEQHDRFAVRWLSKIVPDKIENNRINLLVPSPCIHELVKQNYADQILSLWQEQNAEIGGVDLLLTKKTRPAAPCPVAVPKTVPTVTMAVEPEEDNTISSLLDPTHTFDTFVVGPSNQFASAAARKVAEDDSVAFNPLYIHGGVGLGKTHLLHAIASRTKELFPDKSVLYLSSEQFFHQFIRAMRPDKTNRFESTANFRDLFRSVDVLLIDDIQFICGKKATQEEFFHTFNTLIASGKKIVLSADSLPQDLQGIEERLKTRISQGLVVDIRPASYELRLGILKKKASLMSVSIPADVLDFLACNITSNVRELEGALNRIIAHSELMGATINLETTRSVLKDILNIREKAVHVADIQQVVCMHYGLTLIDLKSTRRERRIARPRQLAMYLAKTLTPSSLPDIGTQFDRDHTTIMHAVKTIENLLPRDEQLRADVAFLTRRLKEG